MTGLVIMYAPSGVAASAAKTAINSGTLWGVSVALAHDNGRYIAALCAPANKPTIISNALANGWRLVTNSGRMSAASLLEDDVALAAYISGRLDERGV